MERDKFPSTYGDQESKKNPEYLVFQAENKENQAKKGPDLIASRARCQLKHAR